MMIDEFTLLKCIGKGAFGEVYISSKQGSQKLFATKKVPKSKADSPAIKKYFINEITILREISHPYIIHFETIKHTIHNYYIITEYCNGGDLLKCLKKYKNLYYHPFTEEIVQHLMRQIVSAIKYLHGRRIIHRDLKLENILVNFDNENDKASMNMLKAKIKVIDFGFATHLGASNLRYSTLGSPINMDPLLLKKLANKNQGNFNLIGYDEKADIWSLGTVCYELLIGQEVFNAQTMIDLIKKVENGNYQVPTNLSKEVVSFLNGMLQYSAKQRLSSDELSKHAFLIKNVKDFKKLDLRKVSNKINNRGLLNINIKRNQSIWAIFNQEDEKTLIDIPGQIYEENPNQKLDELLGITDIVSNNNVKNENPFAKPINININNKMNNNINAITNNNNQINIINKGENIDYNLVQKQQKIYPQVNTKNDKHKRFADYVNIYPYGFGGTNTNTNTNNQNYYNNNNTGKTPPKYYVKNLNGTNNITTNIQKENRAVIPIYNDLNTNTKTVTNQIPQKNKVVQYPQYQYPQYTYTNKPNQPVNYQNTIQNIKLAPVKSNQDLINQGFYQTTSNNINTATTNKIQKINQPSNNNNYQVKINKIQPVQNIQVQNPIIVPQDNPKHKSPKDKLNTSKISAITTVTTKTVQMPKGARMPKSYYDSYSNKQIGQKNTQSKSPINNNDIKYQKQMTYNEKAKDNINNINNIQNVNANNNYANKNKTGKTHFNSTKEIKGYDIEDKYLQKPKDKTITVTVNNKIKNKDESYTIKYENKDFPENNNYSPSVKITKIENTKDEYSSNSNSKYHNHKKSADNFSYNNKNIKKEKNERNNLNNIENIKVKRNDSFPMPESESENENKKDENSNDSKNDDDSSENLDELIDFKLGDEICPEPEDEKYNNLNDNNDKEKEDNFEMTMKKKIMERTVERPTLGVPPPGTDPNDNFDYGDDDDLNNGVFQTNKNNMFNNDDINFEI